MGMTQGGMPWAIEGCPFRAKLQVVILAEGITAKLRCHDTNLRTGDTEEQDNPYETKRMDLG